MHRLITAATFVAMISCGEIHTSELATTPEFACDDPRIERDLSYYHPEIQTFAEPHNESEWPVKVLSIGHTNASYQKYGASEAYFHHGLDIRADAGSDVIASKGGVVVNIENYMAGAAYWEIAIQDDDGYLWQYHHVDHDSIPQQVRQAFRNKQRIAAGTKIGEVFYWSEVTFGERYHHLHLNVLSPRKEYLSPFAFLKKLADNKEPQIVDIGILKNGRRHQQTGVSGSYSIYAQIHDLVLHNKFVVPPYTISYQIDNQSTVTTVWEFSTLPGGASRTDYVDKFFVPTMTCGDYSCRKLIVDLGFKTQGQTSWPTEKGNHQIRVWAADYSGNTATQPFEWRVD